MSDLGGRNIQSPATISRVTKKHTNLSIHKARKKSTEMSLEGGRGKNFDNRYFGMPKGSKDVVSGVGSNLKDFGGQVTWDSKLYNTQANRHIKRDRYLKENSDISDLLKINKDYYNR